MITIINMQKITLIIIMIIKVGMVAPQSLEEIAGGGGWRGTLGHSLPTPCTKRPI